MPKGILPRANQRENNMEIAKQIVGQTMDEERALYHTENALIKDCVFAGPKDGESCLKESRNIEVKDTKFLLRYPLWHVKGFSLDNISMEETTRAALWYDDNGKILNSRLHGIKALRECNNINIENSDVASQEFGWKCSDINVKDSSLESEYIFMNSKNVTLKNVKMKGKYSFQYLENLTIEDSNLDTKDAFWHAKNVTVKNSIVKGEYLAWFSEGLTLIDCKIIGTQPLCYCKNLKLINCTMEDTDLAFEYSDVEADVKGHIISVKNPKSGTITADSVGEIITDDPVMECTGKVIIR